MADPDVVMRQRALGRTGIAVSQVGFGAWGIGGWTPGQLSYGKTDDRNSAAALRAALEIGYTLFDTAPLYGLGHSEELIGAAIRGQRQHVVLATKAGYVDQRRPADFSPSAIERSLTDSLRRLGTDYVDLLQLHSPPLGLLRERPEILETLNRLCDRGLIRSFGLSAASPADAVAGIREFGFPVVQINFNMLDVRAVTDGVLAAARQSGAGVIARTPLCFGFLTGTIAADTVFPAEDHRSRWNGAQVARWVKAAKDVLALAGASPGAAASSAALRFVLSFPEVSAVIPGIATPSEAWDNARNGECDGLSDAVIGQILKYHDNHDIFCR